LGEGELELCLPSPKDGRGAGGEGKDLSKIGMLPGEEAGRRGKKVIFNFSPISNAPCPFLSNISQ
jgi:hypothetical protein